ncbi:unnamed protein product [Psylliodes chrysocephalus]|uniref:UDP-glucuronosyltransferase n=1 Tax=Psylliodes chrysocephalus TaxID=3402493 RepID=A0A9P0CIB6_9CUCU|nr:unnamed protein product [Psylliodes chrysocephala]
MYLIFTRLFCALFSLSVLNAAKILGIFPAPSISHQIIFQPIWKELSLRGHQVTVITPNPLNDSMLTNLTEIDVSFSYELMANHDVIKNLYVSTSIFGKLWTLHEIGLVVNSYQLECDNVRYLFDNKDINFDLVIVQALYTCNEIMLGFGSKFKSPVIAISSLGVFLHAHDAVGNPTHPVISPDIMLNFSGELSFLDRVKSFLFNFWYRFLYYYYALPKADKIARKYFGEDMPYLGDIEKNISLMMLNVNPIIHTVRPNVPNVIEINQMHIRDKKPLPKDLKDYLDASPRGVVYFSLGSNVKSANLSSNIRQEIIGALGELPYNVLWKWESDYLPDRPKNVMTRKWLPQQDILGHPNVKVFVTQGGLQSIEEAITNEVPMVGMPFITDQPSNIKKIEDLGMGLSVDYKTLKKEQLKKAIMEVAENTKYKENVQKSKAILVDQPMKGVEKAVWWIEYVIRHKGAKHLRSPAADMSFFEYFMVDVVLFLGGCVVLALYLVIKIASLTKNVTKSTKKVKKH